MADLLSRGWNHFKEYGLRSTVSAGYNLFIIRTFRFWECIGVHVTPNHYYQPIPDTRDLRLRRDSVWKNSEMVGINMNKENQLRFLEQYFPEYRDEYIHFPSDTMSEIDAVVLYCMIRHFKPSTVIEIGSGYSTLVTAQACQINERKDHKNSRFITIDPYPPRVVNKGNIPGLTRIIPQKVQEVDIEFFCEIKSGDILFIDSTHVSKIGSDVNYLYLEVLPRLNTGVIVHSHDIFLPSEYPEKWVMDDHRFWTEQYLLQAFLTYNSAFEVLWGGAYMLINYPKELRTAFPSYDPKTTVTGSFWLRRKAIKNER